MIGHKVRCTAEGHLADGPRGVVGQVGGQHTDSQLSLR